MSNELREKLEAILAAIGFNDGANKGFWRIQPRDDEGQWMEMGGTVLFRFRTGQGNLVVGTARGTYVGPSGKPGKARVLVSEGNEAELEPGIYELDSRNLTQAKAILPDVALTDIIKSSRKDKFGRPVKSLADSQLPTKAELEAIKTEPTADDERLAKGELTKAEKAAEQDGRKNSPIADLPAGFEAENPDEVKKLLRDSGVDPDEFDKSKQTTQEEPSTGDPVSEIFADVAYNGDTKETLDSVLNKVASTPDNIAKRAASSLQPGEVFLNNNGEEITVVGIKNASGGRVVITGQADDGRVKDFPPVLFDREVNVLKGKKGKIKSAPKPAAKPKEAPATPEPVPSISEVKATEEVKPSPEKPENTLAPTPPPNFPPTNRIDDKLDIEMERLTQEQFVAARKKKATPLLRPDGIPDKFVDENGKIRTPQDPFSLMNALAEVYPNAKFTKDGLNLVLFRTKDKDGKIFELRASNANQKAISYSMRWTDPNTGEIEELFHYDTRDSIQALFTAANGPDGLMDKILGRNGFEILRNGQNWKRGPEATFRERARWFEQKKKMFTAEELTSTLANGPATIYHTDDRNFGRVKKTGYASTWDIVKKIYDGAPAESVKDDFYLAVERIMSKVPTTDLAHSRVLIQLRKDAARLFGGLGNKNADKTVNALFTNASLKAKGKGFAREKDPGFRANPYASANGHTPLEVGMVVEYENNAGVVSIVRVNAKHVNFSVAAGKNNNIYDFGDLVQIVDSEGKTRTLSSKELRVLGNQNTPLTPYTPNPINDALTQYRISTGKIRPRSERQKPTVPGQIDAIADKRPEPEYTALVDDLTPGDDIYDENGVLLGEILDVQPTQDDDGNDGFAFLISDSDGDKISIFYPQGTAVNSLAEIPGATSAKEPIETDPDETVFYKMMAEDTPLSSSINPVPDASSIDAPVGEPVEDTNGKKEVQETRTAVDKVLSVMLEAIKNGEVPWRKPFTDDPRLAGASLPRNPKTKHIYTGTNRLVLRFIADEKGYEDGRWMTYNQATEMGGQVRKGEKGTFILVPRIIPVKDKEGNLVLDDKGNKKTFVKFDAVAVFNVAQIDGLNLVDESKNTDIQAKTPLEAQEFVISRYLKSMEALGLDIPKIRYTYVGEYGSHSSSPNWSPNSDVITLPTLEQFNSPEEIFDTLMHELAHSTGHISRLDRTSLTKDYGNPDGVARAKEELIAEISSALFQQMFGITSNLDNSAAYVQSWLKRLQNNPEEVINATKEAQKVVDYMLGIHLGDWSPVDGYSIKGA